jgi:adenylosuccinate synthase
VRALVIADLGFGDAGKGLLTDFLVRETGATLVVRYNGGAQAGHNVVAPDGRHHTFAQFGSGTFMPGVRTFLARDTIVHPTALLRENAALRSLGIADALDRISISAGALVVTPYHQALGRLRELARGAARHGSCGVGVGETVGHARAFPSDAVHFVDLADVSRLRAKLARIREYARAELEQLDVVSGEAGVIERTEAIRRWMEPSCSLANLAADDSLPPSPTIVFEGAHGVLLDEWHGFHPYTTWSDCTTAPALSLLPPDAEVTTIGVLRAFAVRHGPGPFPTEAPIPHAPHEHNAANEWQGAVRRGWFDAVLARYAIEASGGIDALAITHLDWLPRLAEWTYCDAYDVAIHPPADRSLERQQQLGEALRSVRPVLRRCPAGEAGVVERIEAALGTPVAFGSRGPSASGVFIRTGWRPRGSTPVSDDFRRHTSGPSRAAG